MNPEAVQWLEAITEEQRPHYFLPAFPPTGEFFTLKEDHENNRKGRCSQCRVEELLVID